MFKKFKSMFCVTAIITAVVLLVFTVNQNTPTVAYSATSAPIKIMPLGDSITQGSSWRTILYNKLIGNGFNVQYVGTQVADGVHEGHGGMLVTDLAATTQLSSWLSSTNPDVVLMHFGTNDCWCKKGTTAILNAYTTLVGQMRANNPNMVIFVAKIIPLYPNISTDLTLNDQVVDLNAHIDSWASSLSTSQSPIIVVDQYTGFVNTTDTYDGVHPNSVGGQKMCDNWYNAISSFLSNTTPIPSITPTPTNPVTVTPSPKPPTPTPLCDTVPPSLSPTPTATPICNTVPPTPTPTTIPTPICNTVPPQTPSPTPPLYDPVTPSPVPTPVVTKSLSMDCATNAWQGGYTMNITIHNAGTTGISGWQLIVNKSDFNITSIWCAQVTESGDSLIITPMSYNSDISANGSVNFGIQCSGSPVSNFSYTLK